MSAHRRSLQNPHVPPQLRLLAPKGGALPSHPETPVQHRLHNNIQLQQPTEGVDPATDVNIQQSATSYACAPVHDLMPFALLWPSHSFASLEQNQDSAVAPCPNTYSIWIPSAGGSFPELSPRNLFSGLVTNESHDPSTHQLPDSNLQLQGSIQNQYGEDHLIPMLDSPEGAVWGTMVQPTIGVHESQCFICFPNSISLYPRWYERMLIFSDSA